MYLRAIIVDDEQKGINTLKILIKKHVENLKVVAESTSATEGIMLIENYKPEIVFLDINMPVMTGFELLERLTWKNFNLVFTTAHQEYGLKALKINAIDYLLKPIDYRDLQFAVAKIKSKMEESRNDQNETEYNKLLNNIHQYYKKKIIVNTKIGVESIEVREIIYLEAFSNYTKVYLNDSSSILASKTLKEFDIQLCNSDMNFMRIHNSFIINLNKVLRFLKDTETVVMINSQAIPLSKSRKDDFFVWLNL